MATMRKRWATALGLQGNIRLQASRPACYRYVQARANEFHLGMLAPNATRVTVLVDNGDGGDWEVFEVVHLKDWPPSTHS